MKYIKIDSQAFYVEDVILNEVPVKKQTITKTRYELVPEYDEEGVLIKEDSQPIEYQETETITDENGNPILEEGFVAVECQGGFYKPKWNGTEWVEGLTQEEIQAIKNSALPTEPTLEERLQSLEVMELERILGGM